MKRLASELRMDYTTLKMLNCALVHECTPPDAPYNIRLPVGMGRGAAIALSTMQRSKPEPQVKDTVITHTVIKGETLYFLSRLYGCSVDDICTKNNIEKNAVLSIGKTLYIPVKKAET